MVKKLHKCKNIFIGPLCINVVYYMQCESCLQSSVELATRVNETESALTLGHTPS